MSLRPRHLAAVSVRFGVHLEDELVGLAQFGWVLLELLVLLDLVLVGGVEQQLFDVSGLQPVRGHVHQHLTQLAGGELQMGDEDGCREEEDESTSVPWLGGCCLLSRLQKVLSSILYRTIHLIKTFHIMCRY